MKKSIFLIILVWSFAANAQSLKDALFSGKLKNDTGSVIRKGDDLSTKIDTTTKKPPEPEKKKLMLASKDSSRTGLMLQADSAAIPATGTKDIAVPATDNTVVTKDNNKIWKEFIDSVNSTLKTEVLPNKKIKSGTYYLLVEYEIGVDGQTAINTVSCSPENSFLENQVKERLTLTSPKMNPLLANGKPRKVVKKYTLTLSKN